MAIRLFMQHTKIIYYYYYYYYYYYTSTENYHTASRDKTLTIVRY
jgi:hypothetical protein